MKQLVYKVKFRFTYGESNLCLNTVNYQNTITSIENKHDISWH